MAIQMTLNKGRVPVRIWTREVEYAALQQLENLSRLPILEDPIAVMPDVHLGTGATVGTVIPTRSAIIPAAVGVDIGCGMNALRLDLEARHLPDNLAGLRAAIEAAVPVGFGQHRRSLLRERVHGQSPLNLATRLDVIVGRHPELLKMQRRFNETWRCQLGTLGSGNHFIELCLDEAQGLWIMLHSGSRGIGNIIGRHFIAAARKDMGRHLHALPDKDLAYLSEGSSLFDDYLEAVSWAQDYALENRRLMLELVLQALVPYLPPFQVQGEAISCHHNYVSREVHAGQSLYITRKGAIRAGAGELGIVPGSMGDRSYIVRGLGHLAAYCSSAHGAGRRMSRSEAKRRYTRRDLVSQTRGIECRKDGGVLDEIPGAYKDIDRVMENQADLVEVVHTLRQVLCVKG